MDNIHVDDIVEFTWENGKKEIGVIEYIDGNPRERVLRLEDDILIPLRLISNHELKFITNDLRDDRVPLWLRSLRI